MATVILPAPLRPYAAGQKEVSVDGTTVADALSDLTRLHPALRQHVFDERGDLRAFVHLFVDSEELESAAHNQMLLAGDSRLTLLPSIAGGYTSSEMHGQDSGGGKID
jgi:molybdopterin converting factor small subunit